MDKIIFTNRRQARVRRTQTDPCSSMSMDLFHRKRRRNTERRRPNRSLLEDYRAYAESLKQRDLNALEHPYH